MTTSALHDRTPPSSAASASSVHAARTDGAVLCTATILMGLIAGFFYAYACSVMLGLAETDDRTFVLTMQSINATVRNAAFAPSFFGSLVVTAVAAVMQWRRRDRAALRWIVAALVLYGGAFVITMGVSVPLNNELAGAGHPGLIENVATVRDDYEGPWVVWNIVRAVASTAAMACLVRALMVRNGASGRSPR